MTAERWQRVKELLNTTLEVEPARRLEYLEQACVDEPDLKAEVESLLDSYEKAGDFTARLSLGDSDPLDAEAAPDPRLGERIGHYTVIREIGRGGMGRVYLAARSDDAFRQQVAIKVVKPDLVTGHVLRRFRDERQVMATLEHPNIAHILDGGTTSDGLPYFVMEYIQGQLVDDYCDGNKLSITARLRIFRTVCSAVQYAHDRLIIHRDIKPGNIMVSSDAVPKLLDFGIAKILDPETSTEGMEQTATVLRLMTPEYASPEQVRGDRLTPATDVYSLGVLLYELLTGHRPYRLNTRAPHEVCEAICDQEPEKPSLAVQRVDQVIRRGGVNRVTITPESLSAARSAQPDKLRKMLSGDLDNIVLTALRKEPQRRYASVRDFSDDIQRHLDGLPVRARKDTRVYRYSKWLHRNKEAVIAAVGMAVCLFAALTAARFAWFGNRLLPRNLDAKIVPFTTFAGHEAQPAISPDGRAIAFAWTGENDDNSDIYVQAAQGGTPRRLTTNPARDTSPVWSPDGKEIAFLRNSKEETTIYVTPAQGGFHAGIADLSNRIDTVSKDLDWSPDGNYLAAGDRNSPDQPFGIVLIERRNGRKHRITSPSAKIIGDMSPAFSPDGKSVAFIRAISSGVDDIYVTSAQGGYTRRITSDGRNLRGFAWTADSRAVIFSSERRGTGTLWRVSVSGGEPEQIPVVGDNIADPAISHDGRSLSYAHFIEDANIWRLEIGPSAPGHRPVKLISSTQYDSSPQYSPDGKRIAFRSNRSGTYEIWTSDSEGRGAVQLTHFNGGLTGTPRWSPDGTRIAFDARPQGQPDIFVVQAAGGTPLRITTEPTEDVVPSWSRDGKWIYFASKRSGAWQVWKTVPMEGGSATQVTTGGGFASFESVDGKTLYYAKSRVVGGLWSKPVAGGDETLVLDLLKPAFWGYWAVTADGIYFVDKPIETSHVVPNQPVASTQASIQFFDFRDRQLKRIAVLERPPAVGDSGFAVSPDGRSVLFSQIDQSDSDIMLAVNSSAW